MPCTYMSFQEKAEVAIFVDRTKRNLPFEDQIMLSPVDIEYRAIMSMRAALVEAENERRSKHPFGKKQVPVYREQHGKVSSLVDLDPSNPSPVDKSNETYLHPYSQCQIPANFQLVPEYVQPKTSKAAILKEKACKTLKGKSRIVLAPTAFYTENFVATTPISTSYDASTNLAPNSSGWDFSSVTSTSTETLSSVGLSSFDSLDSIYSLYSQTDDGSSASPSRTRSPGSTRTFNDTCAGRSVIINSEYARSIKHRFN